MSKDSKKTLFIGFEDCNYCKLAYEFLIVCGFDVTCLWASKKRRDKLPKELKNWSGDYLFHMKSYYILPKSLLDGVKIAALNFHPSSPNYPGSGCLNWALYNNEDKTGITVHRLNEKIDNGQIIKTYDVPIFENDNIETLIPRVHTKQLEAFYDIVTTISQNDPVVLDIAATTTANKNIKWGSKTGKIKEIDKLQLVDTAVKKEELEKIIRATSIGKFGPKLMLHGHEFKYVKGKIE